MESHNWALMAQPLPDTDSNTDREYDLIFVGGYMADYILRFRQTVKGRRERNIYLVQEQDTTSPDIISLLLLSPKGDVYEVSFWGRNYRLGLCSCKAAQTGKRCKHRDALEDAIAGKSKEAK